MRKPAAHEMPAVGTAGALADRVILISGAYGGLGRVAAIACARAGATTVLLGRKVPKLNRVYDAIARHADGALPEPLNYPLDLAGASADDYAELAARIDRQLGRLDGLLHCAADFTGLTPLLHTDPSAFARTLHVDLTARWWLTQACMPLLMRADDAAVVFAIDDVVGSGAYRGAYGLAQQVLPSLVAMLSAELEASKVRVSGLRPGAMRTPLRAKAYVEDQDRVARDPSDYAQACVMLLSSDGHAHRGTTWAPSP